MLSCLLLNCLTQSWPWRGLFGKGCHLELLQPQIDTIFSYSILVWWYPSEVTQHLGAHLYFSGAVRLPAWASCTFGGNSVCVPLHQGKCTAHSSVGTPSQCLGLCALLCSGSRFKGSVALAQWHSLLGRAASHAPTPSHCQDCMTPSATRCARLCGRTLRAALVAAVMTKLLPEGQRDPGNYQLPFSEISLFEFNGASCCSPDARIQSTSFRHFVELLWRHGFKMFHMSTASYASF